MLHGVKSLSKNTLVVFALCTAVCTVYGAVFFRYATNVPCIDDYYDTLYFLHLFEKADGWWQKLHILFWQYSDHRAVSTRLISLGYFELRHRVDFYYLSIIGTLQLLPMAWILWVVMKPKDAKIDPSLLIPFMLLFSFAHWRSSYWAMTAVSNFAAVFLAVVIVRLVSIGKTRALIAAAFVLILLMYTQSNGIFMPLLALLQVMLTASISPNIKRKFIFFSASLIFLSIYSYVYQYQSPVASGLTAQQLLQQLSVFKIIIGFFALIGSTPFLETDSIVLASGFGIIIACVLGWMMRWMWLYDRQRFYPVAVLTIYLLFSLLFCSATRVPLLGLTTALDSHYKIYSLTLLSLAFIFLYQQAKTSRWQSVCVGFVLALLVNSYVRDFPMIVGDGNSRRHEVTEWTIKGTHSALGGSGWVPLSEQILFMSANEKRYSPFDSARGVVYQTQHPAQLTSCAVKENSSVGSSTVRLQSYPKTIAARLQVSENGQSFNKVLLCGQKFYYELLPLEGDQTSQMVIDKTSLLPDTYAVYTVDAQDKTELLTTSLAVPETLMQKPCEAEKNSIVLRIRLQVEKDLCVDNVE